MQLDLQDPPPAADGAAGQHRDDASSDTFVIFMIGGQRFAVSVSRVRAILDIQPVFRLPNAPAGCDGVIDVRGESIPLVDLAGSLGIGSHQGQAEDEARIIVFETVDRASQSTAAKGVVADRVLNVARILSGDIEQPPRGATMGQASGTLIGLARMGGELVAILDIDVAISI